MYEFYKFYMFLYKFYDKFYSSFISFTTLYMFFTRNLPRGLRWGRYRGQRVLRWPRRRQPCPKQPNRTCNVKPSRLHNACPDSMFRHGCHRQAQGTTRWTTSVYKLFILCFRGPPPGLGLLMSITKTITVMGDRHSNITMITMIMRPLRIMDDG